MDALTPDEIETEFFAEFYRSLLIVSAKLETVKAYHLIQIISCSEEVLKVVCKSFELAGISSLIVPISEISDIDIICEAVLDDEMNVIKSTDYDDVVYMSVVILKLISNLFEELDHPDMYLNPDRIFRDGFMIGQIGSTIRLELAGLKAIRAFLPGMIDRIVEMNLSASKKGLKSAEKRIEKSNLWKSAAMESAKILTARKRKWSRDTLATEILHHSGIEVGQRTVVNWLKDEAEAPNGPICRK